MYVEAEVNLEHHSLETIHFVSLRQGLSIDLELIDSDRPDDGLARKQQDCKPFPSSLAFT